VLGQRWGAGESSRKLRAQIQVVFQDPFSALSPRMTVLELVGEGLSVHAPNTSAADRQARVVAVLAEVGLSEDEFPGLLARFPHEFSGGQRQRIAIARALILNPRVLILDEPTSALDVSSQRQVVELLQQLQISKGLSYLLITHDMSVIKAMAHHVMVMKGGEVIEFASTQELIRNPKHAYTQLLLEASA
jgi:microcin C transport system ATP-binding protein